MTLSYIGVSSWVNGYPMSYLSRLFSIWQAPANAIVDGLLPSLLLTQLSDELIAETYNKKSVLFTPVPSVPISSQPILLPLHSIHLWEI